jgi:hypothetical protein
MSAEEQILAGKSGAMHGRTLNVSSVRKAYKRWAPVYDGTFGLISSVSRQSHPGDQSSSAW